VRQHLMSPRGAEGELAGVAALATLSCLQAGCAPVVRAILAVGRAGLGLGAAAGQVEGPPLSALQL
jgi:hypothetical protein